MRLEKWPTINRSLQLEKASSSQARGGNQIRKVRSFWSNGFSASIILPDRALRPGRKLQGKVVIHSKALVTFTGLRVQLDGQCTLFLEKNGELVTKRFSVLQPTENNASTSSQAQSNINASNSGGTNNANNRRVSGGSVGGFTSPIACEAVEWLGNSKEIYALIPDINSVVDALTFPFSLEVPGDRAFPCPFNSNVGTLVYKLTAHLCSQDLRYAQIAEETVDFKGYTNLSVNASETLRQICIDRPLQTHPKLEKQSSISTSSITSASSAASNGEISAIFQVEASGFLPEEAVHFSLKVKNPKKVPMHMKVFIAQKVTYGIAENCWKKVTSSVVKCERVEINLGYGSSSAGITGENGELLWRGALIIPKGQLPSFNMGSNGYPSYGVSYTIQFKVEGLDHDWSVKGTSPFYIGTCRNHHQYGRAIITG